MPPTTHSQNPPKQTTSITHAKKATHTFLTTLTHPPSQSSPQSNPLSPLLKTFTTHPTPLIHEHGHPALAPFLGRDFIGQSGVQEYFTTMGGLLGIRGMKFEDEGGWVVSFLEDNKNEDGGIRVGVVVRGWARFFVKGGRRHNGDGDGEGWDEGFVYRLVVCPEESPEEGDGDGEWKVQEYRVWADTGAAYLALRGELGGLERGK
ncbi:uncharacterized protein BO80DRAFT_443133 [Aspergillus ibericus CBS 121593]|uniref:SnoaL-like domain-containing protein n=1 Tax=Aspergillus ibericus CBS 121593 TaxID=1448316 RepID=A0A395H4R6_9EURO|nr:hypothetical protein BO80DRAFT_443133 [Aspergillus ibericus CBS 121593]RAL02882.1 hypothetical protein BO80DRAFT_443133 [Aspergillus ibericus CBS 121593]